VKKPLRALAAASRAARDDGFLRRMPAVGSEDELGELAESLDATLRSITDLHVARTDDALAMSAMQRELKLKEQLEEQHRLLDAASRELAGRFRELQTLAGLSHQLNATLDLDALCAAVADAVSQQLGFSAFALFLADEQQGDYVVRTAFGVDARAVGSRLAPGEGFAGLAAQKRELVLVADVRTDPRTKSGSWLPSGAGSLLAAPMIHQGECVGVLDFWRAEADAFSVADLRFLGSVADQAAMAITNARLHQRAIALSMTDALTGALNRRGLADRLRLEIDRAERFGHTFALAIVDVDHLKRILEGHGLVAGDAVLRRLAGVLQGGLRNVDVLARYRGDKFAVVLPRADRDAGMEAAEALRRAVEAADFPHAPPGGRVTVSAGVASFPQDARDLAGLVDAADAALFAAKRSGRNAVRGCAPEMRTDPARPQARKAAGDEI
jgi:diguanylate cyclase (GGDEF)-like protein